MEINQIKQQLSIHTVLLHYGIKSKPNSVRPYMISCPFHADKTPSLQIYPNSNSFCCHSSNCHAGTGDTIQFIELHEKQGKHQAILKAKELVGGEAPLSLEEVFTKLKASLKRSKKAKEYLASRNLADYSEIGYNAGSYEFLPYCVVFPMRNKAGQMTGLYGRNITKKGHYYSPDGSGLFPHWPAASTKKLIFTESIIDAATLLEHPEIKANYAVLALFGTNRLNEEHLAAIKSLDLLEEIIFFLDGDEAGKKATQAHGGQFLSDYKVSVVETPENEDINGLLIGHDRAVLLQLVEERKNYVSFFSFSTEEVEQKETETEGQLDLSNPDFITYQQEPIELTLMGGVSMTDIDRMRVTMRAKLLGGSRMFRHSLDLYNDDQVSKYARKAAMKLDLGSQQLVRIIAELTNELEAIRIKKHKKDKGSSVREVKGERLKAAISYLSNPELMEQIGQDLGKTGIIGQEVNRMILWLCFSTRKQAKTLHVITMGSSGSGKTHLQESVAALIPQSDKLEITTMSENALYYYGEHELVGKLIVIEDLDGVGAALYPIREIASKDVVTKNVPVKDERGEFRTVKRTVRGPICLAATTTHERVYEDNANRSLLLEPSMSPEQSAAVLHHLKKLSAGKVDLVKQQEIRELLIDVQAILEPIKVVNPFAERLEIPKQAFKPYRTNRHYLAFIEAVTFFHQYQREKKTDAYGKEFIETTLSDIEWANKLMSEVLLAKSDELSMACRSFLERLKAWLKANKLESFRQKEVRKAFRMNPANLKYYFRELTQYGYVNVLAGNRYKGFEYEIADYEEFTKLQNAVSNALDQALEKIKPVDNVDN